MTTSTYSFNKKITPPKYFTVSSVKTFIDDIDKVFTLSGKNAKGFRLNLANIKSASMLGVLIIYKFIEYTSKSSCFMNPRISINETMDKEFEKFGFANLIKAFIKGRDEDEKEIKSNEEGISEKVKEYKKLKIYIGENFIIAPQALLRNDKYSKDKLNKEYLPELQKYYEYDEKIIDMVLLVFSEVLLNFWEHAVEDSHSIIVANGNKQHIEIACADSGNGIIDTLKTVLNDTISKPEAILKEAVKKGVTSKKRTNHMGFGLWILDQIVTESGGRMHIYSQGGYYFNDAGKINAGKCGYWQGSIVYISLPLHNPVGLTDILAKEDNYNLKINWV
ncbi:HAMP domain-containing histidine kinase [Pontibacter sp. KCTC 32443]|uniref:HAMP domain-containing histidine kinase n=1 Tax=Pontibacter TaxID=323449 RepID=UPI00164D4496|nr:MULTISPECIES: HAMP domain-containing histidine kinase [Pontibacter]MBC5773063.1 HAMP domain-containing histidine kinase [Pontibacter sp. KCTC 32443]